MGLGDVVDEFLNQHSLADTSTTEETNLATTGVGGKEIDDLDTSFQDLGSGGLVDECGGFGVNRRHLDTLDGATLVNGLTNNIHDTTQSCLSDGNLNGSTGIDDLGTTDETLGTVHSNGTDRVLTEMGRDFQNEATTLEVLDLEGIEDGREVVGVELDIDDGTNDRFYMADGALCLSRIGASWINAREDAQKMSMEREEKRKYEPGVDAEARWGRATAERCWDWEGTATRGRRAAEEKNAFVCFALLKALFERRATAPREVSMAD